MVLFSNMLYPLSVYARPMQGLQVAGQRISRLLL
jgi:hypothetical protein